MCCDDCIAVGVDGYSHIVRLAVPVLALSADMAVLVKDSFLAVFHHIHIGKSKVSHYPFLSHFRGMYLVDIFKKQFWIFHLVVFGRFILIGRPRWRLS